MVVVLSPLLAMAAYGTGHDWTRAADVGQAYGTASALFAGAALVVVAWSLWLQHSQFKYTQKVLLRRNLQEVMHRAFEEPGYAQCWGAEFAPAHVDERLFFYTNDIVRHWSYAWECGQLTEEQARSYLRQFFQSEVPRMFWERHGDWHDPRRTLTRSDRFIQLMNQEYLHAIKSGPPTRAYQPLTVRGRPAHSADAGDHPPTGVSNCP